MSPTKRIWIFLLVEAAAFLAAASIHLGLLPVGYEHSKAGIAETVIAVVLLLGLAWTRIRPSSARRAGATAQGFAIFGTLIGLFTIAIGVGPQTIPDIAYHIIILGVLGWGLAVSKAAPPADRFQTARTST